MSATYVTIDSSISGARELRGTTNQIVVTENGSTAVLSTPQNLNTGASPTFADLTLSSGLVVGYSATPASAEVHVGDGQFGFNFNSGNPLIPFDAYDYWRFTRGSNLWEWLIGGTTEMALTGSGLQITDGIVVGFSGTPAASEIQVGNAQFGLNYNSGTPLIAFDTNDYWRFTRGSNLWEWLIGGTTKMGLNGGGLQITNGLGVGDGLVVGSGLAVGFAGTPGADEVQVGDGQFGLNYNSGNPLWVSDTNDFVRYTRGSNLWEWLVGGTTEMALNASGLQITDGLVVGFSGTPSADQVRVGDSNFRLNFNSGSPQLVWGDTNYQQYYRSASGNAGDDDLFFVGNDAPMAVLNHAHGALGLGGIFYTDVYGLNWSSRSLGRGAKQADQTQQGFLSVVQGMDPAQEGGACVSGKSYHTPALYVERWEGSATVPTVGDLNDWGNPYLSTPVLVEVICKSHEKLITPGCISARAVTKDAPGVPIPYGQPGYDPDFAAGPALTTLNLYAGPQSPNGTDNYSTWGANIVVDWQSGNNPVNLVGIEVDIVPGKAAAGTGIPGVGDNYTAFWAQAATDKWCTSGLYISAASDADGFGWRYGQVTDTRCTEWLGYYRNRHADGSGIKILGSATSLKDMLHISNDWGGVVDLFSVDVLGEVDIFGGYIQGSERTAPSAPAANGYRIYAQDNGGKTQLMVRFASGAAQQLAIEP